jgi:hypothetical protein
MLRRPWGLFYKSSLSIFYFFVVAGRLVQFCSSWTSGTFEQFCSEYCSFIMQSDFQNLRRNVAFSLRGVLVWFQISRRSNEKDLVRLRWVSNIYTAGLSRIGNIVFQGKFFHPYGLSSGYLFLYYFWFGSLSGASFSTHRPFVNSTNKWYSQTTQNKLKIAA